MYGHGWIPVRRTDALLPLVALLAPSCTVMAEIPVRAPSHSSHWLLGSHPLVQSWLESPSVLHRAPALGRSGRILLRHCHKVVSFWFLTGWNLFRASSRPLINALQLSGGLLAHFRIISALVLLFIHYILPLLVSHPLSLYHMVCCLASEGCAAVSLVAAR